jgi:hypothetical protein
MPLPLDQLVMKALTDTTVLSTAIPKIWQPRLETNLRMSAVFEQSAVVDTTLLVPHSGDIVHIPVLPDLVAAVALTEDTDMTIDALSSSTTVDLTPSEYGKMIGVTRKVLDRIGFDGIAAIIDRLAYSMTLAIEPQFAGLYSGFTSDLYPNGHGSGTIVGTDTFSDALMLDGLRQLAVYNNVPFPDGFYRLYISPGQWKALLQDSDTRQDLRFAAPERLLNGEVGILHGCRIIVTNFIKTATENTQTVNKALLVAPRWAAIAYKRRPEVFVDPTLYDGGRRRQIGATADFQVAKLHADRAVVLSSV